MTFLGYGKTSFYGNNAWKYNNFSIKYLRNWISTLTIHQMENFLDQIEIQYIDQFSMRKLKIVSANVQIHFAHH